MKRFFAPMSPRWQRLLGFAAWGAHIFASAPFLFNVIGRGIGWIIGLFPHPDESWKECSWCF